MKNIMHGLQTKRPYKLLQLNCSWKNSRQVNKKGSIDDILSCKFVPVLFEHYAAYQKNLLPNVQLKTFVRVNDNKLAKDWFFFKFQFSFIKFQFRYQIIFQMPSYRVVY